MNRRYKVVYEVKRRVIGKSLKMDTWVIHKFLLVLLACACEHVFMMLSRSQTLARDRVKKQVEVEVVIFKRKHTYIMTWLYIVSHSPCTSTLNFLHEHCSNIFHLLFTCSC